MKYIFHKFIQKSMQQTNKQTRCIYFIIHICIYKARSELAAVTWLHIYKQRVTSSVYSLQDSTNCITPFPNGDWHREIRFFRRNILRSVWLLQPARIFVPCLWQREIQERNRAEHKSPLPRRTREEDSREISQHRNETQANQELVVLMFFFDVYRYLYVFLLWK